MSHDSGHPRPAADRASTPFPGLTELEPRLLLSASQPAAFDPFHSTGTQQDEVLAAAAGDLAFGIDVSHWQGSINWNSVANDGIDFAYIKATQRVNIVDSRFFSNITGANNAGVLAGAYHFATPYTGGVNDAADEATDFYNTISPYLTDGYLRPALDLESGSSLSTTVLSNWVHDFMNTFSSLSGGIVPIIYTGTSYATNELNSSVNIYDLWYARWPNNPDFNNPPSAPGIWSGVGYDLWQYSDSESVAGISGNVDGDVFFGNLSELVAKYGIITTPDDHGDDLATATPVGLPSTTPGVIGTLGDVDWFELSLSAGTDYTFSVLADGLVSAELRLYSDTGTQITTDSGPAVGNTLAEIQYTAAVGGTYYLSVESSGSGGYDLAVQETDDHGDAIADASELGVGSIGGLQTSTDKDYFHFTATNGNSYDLRVLSAGLSQAVLTLYNSGGGIVRQELGSSLANPMVQILWDAPSDGEMYLAVSSNTGALGDYAVTVAETIPSLTGDLDGDGFVGISDLNVVLGNWNQNVTAGDWLQGDPSGDGFVGIEDLNEVLGNWNAGTPPAVEAASASQSEATAQAAGTQILGIDVSQWQATINWPSVAASGKEFAFIRALDRDGDLDTRFLYNIVNARDAGIWAGAYQFVTPWTDGYNDAVDEARLFATTIAPYLTGDYLRPVIDIEAGPPHEPFPMDLDNTVLTNWVHDYMAEFVRLTGIEPLIYTNTNHAVNAFDPGVNVYDLWLANWTNDPNNPPAGNADGVWNGYDLWQYSSTTSVPGIVGNVDGDVFFGTESELIAKYGIVIPTDDHGNDLASATPLSLPDALIAQADTMLDSDWFAVSLSSGQDYTFSLLAGTLGSAELALYTDTGTLISSDAGPASGGVLAELQYTPLVSGTYYLKVIGTNFELGTYALNVQETDDHGDAIAQASELIGNLVIAGIQSNGDQDFFHFTSVADKQYDFHVLDLGIPDATLTLYDASGVMIDQQAGANPGGTHTQLVWTATAATDMYIAVSAATGSTGDYALSLTVTDAQQPIDGDLDSDGFVGIGDLNVVLGNWNQGVTAGEWSQGDPSGDGFVGIEDLNVVLSNWNTGTPPAASVTSAFGSGDEKVASVESTSLNQNEDTGLPFSHSAGLATLTTESGSRSAFMDESDADYVPAVGIWEEPDALLA